MARAASVIQDHVLLGHLLRDMATKVPIGNEQDMMLRQLAHDLDRVG